MLTRRDALILGASTMALAATTDAPSNAPKLITRRDLPIIGMGTWQTFDVADASLVQPLLARFVELGGKLIDSSPMYGRSEAVVGELVAKLGARDKLFLATKVWTSGKAAGIAQMNDSMAKMKSAAHIDLMQVHNLLDVDTHLATLNEWKREGRVRFVGVTHYTASAHDEVARVIGKHAVDFVQINYSVGEREAERRLLHVAKERGVAVIANRPFAGGELFAEVRKKPLPDWAREIDCTTWAQLLLKFVVSHPSVTFAIPATSKVKHLDDNMGAASGRLPDEAMRARIAAAALA